VLICITGPECSGKTTLSQYLSQSLGAVSVAEYAREYLNASNVQYTFEELDIIAEKQVDLVRDAREIEVSRNKRVVITDTFVLVIVIWSLYKYGKVSERIKALYSDNQPDFYILCRPDLPWKQDPLRENPHDREALFERYLQHIRISNIPFFIVEGLGPERLHKTLQRIESLILNNLP